MYGMSAVQVGCAVEPVVVGRLCRGPVDRKERTVGIIVMDNGVGLRKERTESKKEAGKKGLEERLDSGNRTQWRLSFAVLEEKFQRFLVPGGQAGEEVCCGCGWVKGTSVPWYLSVKGGRE